MFINFHHVKAEQIEKSCVTFRTPGITNIAEMLINKKIYKLDKNKYTIMVSKIFQSTRYLVLLLY